MRAGKQFHKDKRDDFSDFQVKNTRTLCFPLIIRTITSRVIAQSGTLLIPALARLRFFTAPRKIQRRLKLNIRGP